MAAKANTAVAVDTKAQIMAIVRGSGKMEIAVTEEVKALKSDKGMQAALDTVVHRIRKTEDAGREEYQSTALIARGLFTGVVTPAHLWNHLHKLSDDKKAAELAGYKLSDFQAAMARIKQGCLRFIKETQATAIKQAETAMLEGQLGNLTEDQKAIIARNAIVPRTINFKKTSTAKDAPKALVFEPVKARKETRKAGGQTSQVVVQTNDGKATVPTGAQALADMESALAKAPKDILGEIQQRVYSEIRGIAAGLIGADLEAFLKNVRDCCDKLDLNLEDRSGKNQVVSQQSEDQPADLEQAA